MDPHNLLNFEIIAQSSGPLDQQLSMICSLAAVYQQPSNLVVKQQQDASSCLEAVGQCGSLKPASSVQRPARCGSEPKESMFTPKFFPEDHTDMQIRLAQIDAPYLMSAKQLVPTITDSQYSRPHIWAPDNEQIQKIQY